jgi:catechol 2,3-dioxygenase-like lactoylglutathione lyase family enzyme
MNRCARVLVSLLLVSAAAGCGGSSAVSAAITPSSTPSATGGPFAGVGGYFALSVADADATAGWYAEKLGLHVTMRPPKTNQTQVVVLEGSGLVVELLQHDNGLALSRIAPSIGDPMRLHGVVKAGFIVTDLDAAVAELKARNVAIAFGPFPATADQRANVIVRDNEGNLIQLLGK